MKQELVDKAHQESSKKQNSTKKKAKEEFILSKAAELFRQRGYSNTSMDDIGSAVGLLKPSLYHYFKSKDEILLKIIKPAMNDILSLLEELVQADIAPVEKLRNIIDNNYKIMNKYSNLFYTLSQEDIYGISADLRKDINQMRTRYRRLVLEIVSQGKNAGQLRKDIPTEIINYAIIGMLGWMCRTYKRNGPFTTSEITDWYVSLITEGIMVNNRQSV